MQTVEGYLNHNSTIETNAKGQKDSETFGTMRSTTPEIATNFLIMLDGMLQEEKLVNEASLASRITYFHARRAPRIDLFYYGSRVLQYCSTSYAAFVHAFTYVSRLTALFGVSFVNRYSVHRIFLACTMVASKFCDDDFESNSFYARVGGITCQEVNCLECQLLALLDFQMACKASEYDDAEMLLSDRSCRKKTLAHPVHHVAFKSRKI
mmetsp:Transcript_31483/g.88336  ORF Transcript_31483/g.88336 Transcript_31483/m.88336 type:complete len:209 (-) Transcript_31483:144-770(-)